MVPGLSFCPEDDQPRAEVRSLVERIVREEGQTVLGWREVPIDLASVGASAAAAAPVFEQIFVGRGRVDIGDSVDSSTSTS